MCLKDFAVSNKTKFKYFQRSTLILFKTTNNFFHNAKLILAHGSKLTEFIFILSPCRLLHNEKYSSISIQKKIACS